MKSIGCQCEAEIYPLHNYAPTVDESDDGNIEPNNCYMVYRRNAEHTHDETENWASKLSEETKRKIIDFHIDGKKPQSITYKLRGDKSIPLRMQPTKTQIKNVIANYKNAEYGKDPLTMRKLTEIVEAHMQIHEQQIDKPFIVGFERSPSHEKDKYFRMFISTKRLLENAADAKIIHADGTYKVTVGKLPLIVIGCSDAVGEFHLAGLMITSHETADAYTLAFHCLKMGISKITGILCHKTIIFDG